MKLPWSQLPACANEGQSACRRSSVQMLNVPSSWAGRQVLSVILVKACDSEMNVARGARVPMPLARLGVQCGRRGN